MLNRCDNESFADAGGRNQINYATRKSSSAETNSHSSYSDLSLSAGFASDTAPFPALISVGLSEAKPHTEPPPPPPFAAPQCHSSAGAIWATTKPHRSSRPSARTRISPFNFKTRLSVGERTARTTEVAFWACVCVCVSVACLPVSLCGVVRRVGVSVCI